MVYNFEKMSNQSKDYDGSISANWQSEEIVSEFYKEYNISSDRYKVIAIEAPEGSDLIIYAADLKLIYATSSSIHDYAIKNYGRIPIVRLISKKGISDLKRYFKNISIFFFETIADVNNYEEVDTIMLP